MNCIYRIVWNAATGKWVVASELARGRRRARAGAGAALVALGMALASPSVLASDISELLCAAQEQDATTPQCDLAHTDQAGITGAAVQADVDDALLVVNAGANATAASTTGVNMIAIGSNAIARPAPNGANMAALALGSNTIAAGSNAVAVGYGASANSDNGSGTSGATAVGASSRAIWNATAVGFQANGQGTVVTALGAAATATGERGIALGNAASATGQYASAIGAGARAMHANSVAIGQGAQTRGTATFAVGSTTRRRQIENLADGTAINDATTVQQLRAAAAALGGGAGVDALGGVTAPRYDLANGGVQSTVGDAIAALDGGLSTLDLTVNRVIERLHEGSIGLVGQVSPGSALTMGALHDGAAVQLAGTQGARTLRGMAAGVDTDDAVTLAQLHETAQTAAAGLGGGAHMGADGQWNPPVYTVAGTDHGSIGSALLDLDGRVAAQRAGLDDLKGTALPVQRYFQAEGDGSDAAQASGTDSVAMGSAAAATARNALAVGNGANAATEGGIAIGAGASAGGINAIALGAGAVADRDNVLSIGNSAAGLGRQLINVANGTQGADVVNASQLRAVIAALGGGATFDPATGAVTGPRYDLQQGSYTDVGAALSAVDGDLLALDVRTTVNAGDIVDVQRQLVGWGSGQAGLVQQATVNATVSVGAALDGFGVDFTGTAGARQLKGISSGQAITDAVNVGQMQQVLAAAQPQDSRYMKVDGAADGSDDANANGSGALALGAAASGNGTAATAIGHAAHSSAEGSVALGAGSAATRANTVAIGAAGNERQLVNVADASEDTDAINLRQLKAAGLVGDDGQMRDAVGYSAGSGRGQVMFGGHAGTVLGNVADGLIDLGSRQAVNGGQFAAMRDGLVEGIEALDGRVDALGGQGGGGSGLPYYGTTGSTELVANGAPAAARGEGAVAAGAGAVASADNAVALGAGAMADRADSVSVGTVGAERQVGNVAAAVYETDAINVDQLREQMASANSYTDQRVDALWSSMNEDIGHMHRQINRGIAASAALVQVTPNLPGKVTLNAGVARYRGESAFGVGLSRWSRGGRYNVNAGVSAARGDQALFNIGFGIAFD